MTLLERIRERLLFWRWYLTEYVPIAGAADDDDADDSDDDADDSDDDDEDDSDEDADDQDQDKPLDEAEAKRLRKAVADARVAEREAKRKLKKAEEQKAKDQGKFKDLYEQEKAEREKAEAKAEAAERNGRVEKIAKRLGFQDPSDAHRFLDADVADDALIERELKDVLEEKDYLKADRKSSSRPVRTRREGGEKKNPDKAIRRMAGRA